METYPVIREISRQKWKRSVKKDENIKGILRKLEQELVKQNIPLSAREFVTGHEDVVFAASQLNHINERFSKGETILHWTTSSQGMMSTTSRYGQNGVLILLLLGADPNVQDILGRTPLHWAVNHEPFLIEDLDKDYNTVEALDCFGNLRKVIPSETSVAETEDKKHTSRLISEALRIVCQLLHFKASPNVVDIYGATPLCHAIWSKLDEIVEALRPITDTSLVNVPEFNLCTEEKSGDIRPSHISKWIDENTKDVDANRKCLRKLLCTAGTGILHHYEEVQMQIRQVMTVFER